jgi:hypothetical protein
MDEAEYEGEGYAEGMSRAMLKFARQALLVEEAMQR